MTWRKTPQACNGSPHHDIIIIITINLGPPLSSAYHTSWLFGQLCQQLRVRTRTRMHTRTSERPSIQQSFSNAHFGPYEWKTNGNYYLQLASRVRYACFVMESDSMEDDLSGVVLVMDNKQECKKRKKKTESNHESREKRPKQEPKTMSM